MNTLSSTRISAVSPLAIGIFVAGLLMFGVVAIVRSVTTQPSDIGATTAASLTAIPWDHIPSSNNVASSLPAFNIQKPADATVVSVFDNQVKGITLIEVEAPVIDLSWATRDWLTIATDRDGRKWVYGNAWFSCQHIDQDLIYRANIIDPALRTWNELAPRKQSELAKECSK